MAVLYVAASDQATANHVTNSTSRWSVDADVTGNDATTLGALDSCITAAVDTDVMVDLIVEDIPAVDTNGTPEIEDDSGGAFAFHAETAYDASAMSVTGVDAEFLLGSLPGSSIFTVLEVAGLPDTDGLFQFDAVDLGVVPDTTESGSGVLARVTFHIDADAAPGAYTISVPLAVHYDPAQVSYLAPIVYSAQIAVGVPCPGNALVGDVDCNGNVNSVDGLKILRASASLPVAQTEPCNDMGTQSPPVGDVDCNGTTTAVDALKILRSGAGLGYSKVHYCDDIGT